MITSVYYISILLEIIIIARVEKVIWGTYYTPINFLSIPYLGILTLTILFDFFVKEFTFYGPSILIWNIGLLIFFIPSLIIGFKYKGIKNCEYKTYNKIEDYHTHWFLILIFICICVLFALRIKSLLSSGMILGSDEFSEAFSKNGLYAHLKVFFTLLTIVFIARFNKNNKVFYTGLIILGLLPSVIYNVKGWILVPVVSGLIIKAIKGHLNINISLLLKVGLIGGGIFILSYILTLVIAQDGKEFDFDILSYILSHLIFYLISGVGGLSQDLYMGMVEQFAPEVIVAPFANIWGQIAGTESVSPINPFFLLVGYDYTNVRTFFGTLYVNSGIFISIVYTLLLSGMLYVYFLLVRTSNNIWLLSGYAFLCALLCLGWFEFYFFHLMTLEVPLISFIFALITSKRVKKLFRISRL